jgi:hypothetical protein
VFVTGDVISFLLQGAGMFVLQCYFTVIGLKGTSSAGGGIQSSGSLESMKTGEHIIVAGLFIQLFFFGFFIVTSSAFDYKLRKYPIPRCFDSTIPWRKYLNALYVTSFLILVRSLFRVAEYLQGNDGYLLHHEIFLYIFDAVLMLAAMVAFNIVHPHEIGDILRQPPEYKLTRFPDDRLANNYGG